MQTDKSPQPKIFYYSSIDSKDDIEEKLDKARMVLQRLVSVGSERETHDALQNAVCRDKNTHDDISLGLLANILTDPGAAGKWFRDLSFVSRDMAVVVDTLVAIVLDKYHRLTDVSRNQLMWMVKELVRAGMSGADMLCWNMLRQIAGGDVSNRNLWLSENMLEIFVENRTWLEKFPILIGAVIVTYLRILEDHFPPNLSNLRQKEANFVVGIIRDHFATVVMNPNFGMGRDFVRLLQGVSRIPEIQAVWVDVLYNPKVLSPRFTGLVQLLNIRTSRKFLQSRLTPDMEKKIMFLTSQVKFGMHKRYQDWFQKQFLATPESQTLRADIIRFIVGVIHPPNEILCSDILPRWAVIGWLLTTCTSPVAAANAKLALFFDWLIFDPIKDNIMNIEPGILVMFHSMRPHLAITATLLDFLIRQITEFWPGGADLVRGGIGAAFRTILDKKVLPSLDPIFDNTKLEPELRTAIQDVLVPLIRKEKNGDSSNNNNSNAEDNNNGMFNNEDNSLLNHHAIKSEPSFVPDTDARFSDDEVENDDDNDEDREDDNNDSDEDRKDKKPLSMSFPSKDSPNSGATSEEAERSRIFDLVQILPTNMRIPLDSMLTNPSDKGESLEEVLEECAASVPIEKDQREALVKALVYIYRSELMAPCVEEEEYNVIEDNVIVSPIIDIMTQLLQCKPSDKTVKMKNLFKILSDIVQAVPRVAYKILLILNQLSFSPNGGPATKDDYYPLFYKNLCSWRGIKLEQALHQDIKACWEIEPVTVGSLCPIVFDWYGEECIGSLDILRLVVSTIDSSQLQDIVWRLAQGDFIMIDKPDIVSLISKTLDWETWEQHCVWTILEAHQFDIDDYFPIIPMLDYKSNAEALTALFLKLKNERPSDKILGPCLCRKPNTKDRFVLSLLAYWSETHKDVLAEVLSLLLVRACGSPAKRKRGTNTGGRGGMSSPAGPATPSIEHVLGHLDLLREQIDDSGVFTTDMMQAALLQVNIYMTEAQRNKYKAILDLAAIEESSDIRESRSVVKRNTARKQPASPNSGGGQSSSSTNSITNTNSSSINSLSSSRTTRSGRATRQAVKDDSDSSSSNDEDEIIRPRNPKKRKKTSALNSDSD